MTPGKAEQQTSLEALARQLEDGDFDLSMVEGLLNQMTSLTGMMQLFRSHSTHLRAVRVAGWFAGAGVMGSAFGGGFGSVGLCLWESPEAKPVKRTTWGTLHVPATYPQTTPLL